MKMNLIKRSVKMLNAKLLVVFGVFLGLATPACHKKKIQINERIVPIDTLKIGELYSWYEEVPRWGPRAYLSILRTQKGEIVIKNKYPGYGLTMHFNIRNGYDLIDETGKKYSFDSHTAFAELTNTALSGVVKLIRNQTEVLFDESHPAPITPESETEYESVFRIKDNKGDLEIVRGKSLKFIKLIDHFFDPVLQQFAQQFKDDHSYCLPWKEQVGDGAKNEYTLLDEHNNSLHIGKSTAYCVGFFMTKLQGKISIIKNSSEFILDELDIDVINQFYELKANLSE